MPAKLQKLLANCFSAKLEFQAECKASLLFCFIIMYTKSDKKKTTSQDFKKYAPSYSVYKNGHWVVCVL